MSDPGRLPAALDGRVALLTGAGGGIGRAAALLFARAGARVTVADVHEGNGEETAALVREAGGEALFVRCDVTSEDDVRRLVATTAERWGRLDCAFNNAGVGSDMMRVDEYDRAAWDRMLGINLTGVWLCMKHEIAQMRQQGGGTIVNTASILGERGIAGFGAYTAAKHGVLGLTRAAALECAPDGIRVNAVCPGFIETALMTEGSVKARPGTAAYDEIAALHPLGRVGQPQEIADAALWLCSDASAFVAGHALAVDGGYMAR